MAGTCSAIAVSLLVCFSVPTTVHAVRQEEDDMQLDIKSKVNGCCCPGHGTCNDLARFSKETCKQARDMGWRESSSAIEDDKCITCSAAALEAKCRPHLERDPFSSVMEFKGVAQHHYNRSSTSGHEGLEMHPCDGKKLKANSQKIGEGGNAYALRLKNDFPQGGDCKGKKGDVLKAFNSEEEAIEVANELGAFPPELLQCGIAALKCTKDRAACLMTSQCVNSDGFYDWKETDTCYFVRMQNGGDRTLEQCAEAGKAVLSSTAPLGEGDLRRLMLGAVRQANCIHAAGWYHGDFQLKNIMTARECNHKSVRAVDLDGMGEISKKTGSDAWNGPHRLLRDLEMIFGVHDCGAMPLDEMVPKALAKKAKVLMEKASAAMATCNGSKKKWECTVQEALDVGKAVEAAMGK